MQQPAVVEVREESSLELVLSPHFFHLLINNMGGSTQIFALEAGTLQLEFCISLTKKQKNNAVQVEKRAGQHHWKKSNLNGRVLAGQNYLNIRNVNIWGFRSGQKNCYKYKI